MRGLKLKAARWDVFDKKKAEFAQNVYNYFKQFENKICHV